MAAFGLPLNGLLQALSSLSLADESPTSADASQRTPPSNRVYGSSEPPSQWSASTVDTSNLQTPNSDHEAVTLGTVDGKAELDRRLQALAQSALVPSRFQTAALQPRHDGSSDEHLADDEDDADDGASLMSGSSAQIEGVDEKLRIIQGEFGTLDYLPMEERWMSEAQSALISNVLVVGRLFVTSHRVAFFAIIPKLEEDMAAERANIIRQGPLITHMPRHKGKRIWAVLTRDDFSLHATNKVPMISVHEVLPVDSAEPKLVQVRFLKRWPNKPTRIFVAKMYFDTEEMAREWRHDMAATLFQYNNVRDRFRASIPLDRIVSLERRSLPFGGTDSVKISYDASATSEPEIKELTLGICPTEDTIATDMLHNAWRDVLTQVEMHGSRLERSPPPTVEIYEPPKPKAADGETLVDDDPDVWASSLPVAEEPEDLTTDDHESVESEARETALDRTKFGKRKIRLDAVFALPVDELLTAHQGELNRLLPTCGVIGVGRRAVYFHAKRTGGDIKLRVPLKDIKDATAGHAVRMLHYGVVLHIRGAEAIQLETHHRKKRDQLLKEIQSALASQVTPPISRLSTGMSVSSSGSGPASPTTPPPSSGRPSLISPRLSNHDVEARASIDAYVTAARHEMQIPQDVPAQMLGQYARVVNLPDSACGPSRTGKFSWGLKPMRIHCMTIGSRGDVQPYIALCVGLMKDGHHCTIVTHPENKAWVESYGISFKEAGGDPALLMQVSVEHKIFSLETIGKFRDWFIKLLDEAYAACSDADLLIESPSTFAGIHVAEAYRIGYMRAFTMPWTKTRDFPHALLSGPTDSLESFNIASYGLFDSLVWRASSGMINKFRKRIGLQATDLESLHTSRVPFIYNFSTAVVPRPDVSGYWQLPTLPSSWTPSDELLDFLAKAKKEGKPLVYIGFGSITIPDPVALTEAIVASVQAADVRVILSKGWSARLSKVTDNTVIPPELIHVVDSIPHDWLFAENRISAAMHHGGAGTTAASLTNGLVTLIHPFFGDQYFWAKRVHALGAGLRVKSLSAHDLTDALIKGTRTAIMREKAEIVGAKLRAEDGVANAKAYIYRMLDRAAAERGGVAPGAEAPRESPSLARSSTMAASPSPHAAVALTARRSSTVPVL